MSPETPVSSPGAGRRLAASFTHALGQISTLVGPAPRMPYPDTRRTAAQALQGDWERLGGDMRKAAAKVPEFERG